MEEKWFIFHFTFITFLPERSRIILQESLMLISSKRKIEFLFLHVSSILFKTRFVRFFAESFYLVWVQTLLSSQIPWIKTSSFHFHLPLRQKRTILGLCFNGWDITLHYLFTWSLSNRWKSSSTEWRGCYIQCDILMGEKWVWSPKASRDPSQLDIEKRSKS